MEEKKVIEAINVILSDKKSYPKSLNYAVDYCRHALYMTGEDLRTQCLYILSNISHWRHPEAKNVRATLNTFVKRG